VNGVKLTHLDILGADGGQAVFGGRYEDAFGSGQNLLDIFRMLGKVCNSDDTNQISTAV
jgi:hypothetical protein